VAPASRIDPPHRRARADTEPRGSVAATSALTLLVVDDDLLQARLIKGNLERPGRIAVEVAGSADAALARLAGGPLDAVLTDLSMPEMDGIELVRRIRESDPLLPVIIMTAHATLERAVEGIRAGATDFLQKPVNVSALLTLVERAVAERPLREEL
jgi:DNA-binding NtrC family response regulator